MVYSLLLGGLHSLRLSSVPCFSLLLQLEEISDPKVHDALLLVLELLVVEKLSIAL